MILGGGRGTRLWPLTKYRAKPAVPVAGKYRLIDIPISNCLNSGIERIYILTQFNSSSLNRHISSTYQLSPFSRGFVQLEAASQSAESTDWFQGTADAVKQKIYTITQWHTPYVLILPGDAIYRMDLNALLRIANQHQADVTVALHPVDRQRTSAFGIATMGDDGRVTQLVEKPGAEQLEPLAMTPRMQENWGVADPNRAYLGSMGIYLFRTEVLVELIEKFEMIDFGNQILPYAVQNHRIHGYVFNDFWEDIGSIEAFYAVNLALSDPKPPFIFYDSRNPIFTHRRFLPSTQMDDVTLRQTKVAEGCVLRHAAADQCLIGIRSIVGRGVQMRRTIMMGADYYEEGISQSGHADFPADAPPVGIGDDCEIEGAIIDKNARVGHGTKILNRDGKKHYDDPEERYYIRDGVVMIPKNSIIPPETIV